MLKIKRIYYLIIYHMKVLYLAIFSLFLFSSSYVTFAADETSSNVQKILTSERVPGATCTCVVDGASLPEGQSWPTMWEAACENIKTRKYMCLVPRGLAGFESIFAEIVRTIVFIVMILGVLAIVWLGIAWAWAGGDDVKMKSTLKNWAFNVIIGLVILFMFRYILTFLAPWIFQ